MKLESPEIPVKLINELRMSQNGHFGTRVAVVVLNQVLEIHVVENRDPRRRLALRLRPHPF